MQVNQSHRSLKKSAVSDSIVNSSFALQKRVNSRHSSFIAPKSDGSDSLFSTIEWLFCSFAHKKTSTSPKKTNSQPWFELTNSIENIRDQEFIDPKTKHLKLSFFLQTEYFRICTLYWTDYTKIISHITQKIMFYALKIAIYSYFQPIMRF